MVGDISAEPSMEEILSSIKRIIAEEGEPPARGRRARPVQPLPPVEADDEGEVLELDTPVPAPVAVPAPAMPGPATSVAAVEPNSPAEARAPEPRAPEPGPAEPARPTEPILSRETADASRGSLEALTRLVTRPDPGSDGTLEGLVREMLRPMLREWLDASLPGMVQQMVSREIAKITGQLG